MRMIKMRFMSLLSVLEIDFQVAAPILSLLAREAFGSEATVIQNCSMTSTAFARTSVSQEELRRHSE